MKKTERLNRNYRTEWSVFFTTMMMIWILESHYLVAISPAQESPDALLKNAKAVFDVITDPTPEDIQTPIVQLGRHLFWDSRLSANGKVACASCHAAQNWGADSEPFSLDAKGKRTKRHSQTVLNALLQPKLRWTGDRESGAHQAEKSLTGSMGFTNGHDVIALLKQNGYEPLFQRAFPTEVEPMSSAHYARAIEAYESTLRSSAPFDRYLNGQIDALTEEQHVGLNLFLKVGCTDCHSGQLLGGERFEKFGVHHDYWTETGSENPDWGLFESTMQEEDRYRFRTAMLRNIEKTGPYFHDGSVTTLAEAVRIMAKVQLDQELDAGQIQAIVAFLGSLTGKVPAHYSAPEATTQPKPNEATTGFELVQYGSMHETIGRQQHQGRVSLGELVDRPNFYAVGALEQLQGEVTILASQLFVTCVLPEGTLTSRSDLAESLQATLLVGGEVPMWTSVPIPEPLSGAALESFILRHAETLGIETKHPFPFLIEGPFSKVRLHVINGACPVHARTRKKPIPQEQQPFEHEFAKLDGQLLGIFAQNAAGKLTHPGTSMHAHLVFVDDAGQQITGHVEAFQVEGSSTLRLPSK